MLYTLGLIIFAVGVPVIIPLSIIAFILHIVRKNAQPPARVFSCAQQQENFTSGSSWTEQNTHKSSSITTSGILLLIGTAFVILSGIAFGVASWVNTTPVGRVLIMIGAAVFSMAISTVLRMVIKLKKTSAAFYILSTVLIALTLIVSGYYGLLGDWLAIPGEGSSILMAISCFVTFIALLAAYWLYSSEAFVYTGLSALSMTFFFISVQISEGFADLAVIMIALQAIITALIHAVKLHEKTEFAKPVKIVGTITALIFGFIAFIYTLSSVFSADVYTYIILGMMILQFIGYGIFKKHFWMLGIQSVLSVYTAIAAGFTIDEYYSFRDAITAAAVMFIGIYLLNRFSKHLHTGFSEIFTLAFAILGGYNCIGIMDHNEFVPELIIAVIVSALIASYVFSRYKAVQAVSGLAAPITPIVLTSVLTSIIVNNSDIEYFKEIRTVSYCILALIFIAITAALIYLPKYAFSFHAKHPRRADDILYANMIAAGGILLFNTVYSELFFIPAFVTLIHFAVSNRIKCNLTAAISVMSLTGLVYNVARHYADGEKLIVMTALMVLFIIMMIVSKLIYSESIIKKGEDSLKIDPMMISAWLPIVLMGEHSRTGFFMVSIALAIYFACFIRKNVSREASEIILTISTAITSTAFIFRPFFIADSEMISSKITLAIIALTGTACRFIWRRNKEAAKLSSTLIYILCFGGLLIDAMYFQTSGNTIFVMAITALVLIISLMTKCRTWFMVSSITLFTITIHATRHYLTALNWWVYLFAAGMILITVAAVNEYCKTKGETVRSNIAKVFSDWTW